MGTLRWKVSKIHSFGAAWPGGLTFDRKCKEREARVPTAGPGLLAIADRGVAGAPESSRSLPIRPDPSGHDLLADGNDDC